MKMENEYYIMRKYPKGASYRMEIFPTEGIVSGMRRIIGNLLRGRPYTDNRGAIIDGQHYTIREWGVNNFPVKYNGVMRKFKKKCYEHKKNTGKPLKKSILILKLSKPSSEFLPLPKEVVKVSPAFNCANMR